MKLMMKLKAVCVFIQLNRLTHRGAPWLHITAEPLFAWPWLRQSATVSTGTPLPPLLL